MRVGQRPDKRKEMMLRRMVRAGAGLELPKCSCGMPSIFRMQFGDGLLAPACSTTCAERNRQDAARQARQKICEQNATGLQREVCGEVASDPAEVTRGMDRTAQRESARDNGARDCMPKPRGSKIKAGGIVRDDRDNVWFVLAKIGKPATFQVIADIAGISQERALAALHFFAECKELSVSCWVYSIRNLR